MICNLKVLGLSLAAVFTMNAMAASAASAAGQGHLTAATYPATLIGADITKSVLTYNGTQKFECNGTYDAGAQDETVSAGVHKFITGALTITTVTPTYTNCVWPTGELITPETVTMNGCDYLWHIGETVGGAGAWAITVDLVCPAGVEAEIHVVNGSHIGSLCTYKYPAQAGKTGMFIRSIGGGKLTLGGTLEGMSASRTGILCGGNNSTTTAKIDIDAEVDAKNGGGAADALSITE